MRAQRQQEAVRNRIPEQTAKRARIVKDVATLNVQIFVAPVARLQELAAAMNGWLAEHPAIEIEDEAVPTTCWSCSFARTRNPAGRPSGTDRAGENTRGEGRTPHPV